MQRKFLLIISMILLTACNPVDNRAATAIPALFLPGEAVEQVDFSQVSCQTRSDDPQGYLLSICEYILKNEINTSPADPSKINILEIREEIQDDHEVLVVLLDCCGMGDRAILDAASGKVLKYHLGDY